MNFKYSLTIIILVVGQIATLQASLQSSLTNLKNELRQLHVHLGKETPQANEERDNRELRRLINRIENENSKLLAEYQQALQDYERLLKQQEQAKNLGKKQIKDPIAAAGKKQHRKLPIPPKTPERSPSEPAPAAPVCPVVIAPPPPPAPLYDPNAQSRNALALKQEYVRKKKNITAEETNPKEEKVREVVKQRRNALMQSGFLSEFMDEEEHDAFLELLQKEKEMEERKLEQEKENFARAKNLGAGLTGGADRFRAQHEKIEEVENNIDDLSESITDWSVPMNQSITDQMGRKFDLNQQKRIVDIGPRDNNY